MLIPLGILASAGGAAGSYELIETYTVGSGGIASVTFDVSSYSSTYQHLQIRWASRSTSTLGGVVLAQLNSDTAANYSTHYLVGVPGTGVVSGAVASTSNMYVGQQELSSAASGAFGAGVIDLLDAYEAKYKTTRGLAGASGGQRVILTSGSWRNTDAISSVKLYADSGNLAQYSRFSIYGLKGA